MHKPARHNYLRHKYDIRGIDETWQADLVIMESYSKVNKGFKNILTSIDNFSKFDWVVALKDKSDNSVSKALASVLKQERIPINLQVDQGTQFYNSE